MSLRKEGKGFGEISQQLPGRSKMACSQEYYSTKISRSRKQARAEWQPWERDFLISLRKEGKDFGEISQQLPGRSKMVCAKEYQKLLKSRKQVSTSEKKTSLADSQETKRPWVEWEDKLVTTSHIAGKSCGEISRLLSSRTASAVSARWEDYLKPRLEDTFTAPGDR